MCRKPKFRESPSIITYREIPVSLSSQLITSPLKHGTVLLSCKLEIKYLYFSVRLLDFEFSILALQFASIPAKTVQKLTKNITLGAEYETRCRFRMCYRNRCPRHPAQVPIHIIQPFACLS